MDWCDKVEVGVKGTRRTIITFLFHSYNGKSNDRRGNYVDGKDTRTGRFILALK